MAEKWGCNVNALAAVFLDSPRLHASSFTENFRKRVFLNAAKKITPWSFTTEFIHQWSVLEEQLSHMKLLCNLLPNINKNETIYKFVLFELCDLTLLTPISAQTVAGFQCEYTRLVSQAKPSDLIVCEHAILIKKFSSIETITVKRPKGADAADLGHWHCQSGLFKSPSHWVQAHPRAEYLAPRCAWVRHQLPRRVS